MRERSFGLIRADGSEKPAALVMRRFAARLARAEVSLGEVPKLLDVSCDAYYAAPAAHFRRLYELWLSSATAAW